jgi:hypothetical protein
MDMKFGTWNIRSLYSAGSLMTDGKKNIRIKVTMTGSTGVAPNQQAHIHVSVGRGMRIMN